MGSMLQCTRGSLQCEMEGNGVPVQQASAPGATHGRLETRIRRLCHAAVQSVCAIEAESANALLATLLLASKYSKHIRAHKQE